MESKDIQNSILKAVDTIATRRISQLELDKTITAIIKNSVGIVNRRKIYKVQYNGGFFNATAQNEGDAYLPGMAVYVSIPQGNFSNEKFIIGRANSLATNEQVSAVVALANNYGIVGANNIDGNTTESGDYRTFGVYSYHSPEEENTAPESIFHRYNLLYKYGEVGSALSTNTIDAKLYAKDTNAIMFRADFMNILSSEQKAKVSGEFGVVFNLAFKNKAFEIGETQGEILDYYADVIKTEETNDNDEIIIKTLKQYIEKVALTKEEAAAKEGAKAGIIWGQGEEDFEEAVALDKGSLDQVANDILALVGHFSRENPAAYNDLADSIVNAYIRLIEELRTVCKSFEEMQEEYEIWRETKIKEPEEKIVSYYLSSNSMIGNPFHFSSWISQYEVFEVDLESFLRLDSIILYKEGFIQDASKEASWPLPTPIQEEKGIKKAGPDIFVRNLQMYFMKPLSDYNGKYQLKVESPKQGLVFHGNEAEDYKIKLTATFLRETYEDLSRNQNTKFYWFKSDGNIVSPNQSEYSPYGGLGWAEIPNNNSYKLYIDAESCPAYENHFLCVAVYTGEETPIILKYDVRVRNMKGRHFMLQSDLGNQFGFDAGNPVLTLLTRENEEDEFVEIDNDIIDGRYPYKFYWYLMTNNAQKVFLVEKVSSLNYKNISIENLLQNQSQTKLLRNIEYYYKEDKLNKPENYWRATRIKYPMSNLGDSTNVTFEVYIEDANGATLGKADIKLSNLESGTINDYQLVIENGEQVFQYDEYGNAPNSKKLKDPLQILPLRARLFDTSNLEITETNFRTQWLFPIEKSMIKYDETQAKYDPSTGRSRIFEGSEINLNIADIYDPNTVNNNIVCVVTLGEKVFKTRTNFLFTKVGGNGTNGTDMVVNIEPAVKSEILEEQPVTVYTQSFLEEVPIEDSEETQKIWVKKSAFNFESGNDPDSWEKSKLISKALKPRLFQKSQEINLKEDGVRIVWNIAGNPSTSNNKNGKYLVIKDSGNDLCWDNNEQSWEGNKLFQSIVKVEIQYDKDKDKKGETYYAFYTLPLIEYMDEIPSLRKNRIGIKNDTYLKEIIYNSDGRNPSYNNTQGLELLNVPDDCYITWIACGGITRKIVYVPNEKDPETYNQNYEYSEENAQPTFMLLPDSLDGKREAQGRIEKYTNEEGVIEYPPNKVYVLPDDSISGNITNNYIKAEIRKKDESDKLIAIVQAPISFSLDTFGLASINAWDGNSITLDDENGAILAPQIGAGSKDDNNKFTGVVMGVAEDHTTQTPEILTGLIGMKEGNRSFFLDAVTGKATFGIPNIKAYTKEGSEEMVPISGFNKIRRWNKTKQEYEEIDDYNEGQIILDPGGQSIIGGWRIGRQVLYYTTDTKGDLKDIKEGSSYDDAWAERALHRRDIGREHKGILLNAAPLPYISIKGRPLKVGNKNVDNTVDIDSWSGNAEMLNGDSLELNLDPNQKDFFTLFVHHKEEKENGEEEWTRTPLVGIDPAGRFYSNSVRDKETALTMNHVAGFGANSYNKKYVGLLVDYTEDGQQKPILKAFRSTNYAEGATADKDVDTTFISGGVLEDEYARPLSFHGREISLYSSGTDSIDKTTRSNLLLQDGELSAELTNTNIKFTKNNSRNEDNNIINTYGDLKINIGTVGTGNNSKSFRLNTGPQVITAKYGCALTNTESGGITITSKGDSNADINIKRETGDTSLSLQKTQAKIKVSNDKSYLLLNNETPTYVFNQDNRLTSADWQASRFYSTNAMELTSEERVVITGTGNTLEDPGDGKFYGIVLKAKASPQSQRPNDYVLMRMGVYDPGKTGDENSSYSMPFELEMSNSGNIRVYHGTNPYGENIPATTCMFGMNINVSHGLQIEGGYTGVGGSSVIAERYGLVVNKHVRANGYDFSTDLSHTFKDGDFVSNKDIWQWLDKLAAKIDKLVADEEEARAREIGRVEGLINEEARVRGEEDNSLSGRIAQEVTDRNNAIDEALYDGSGAKFLERGVPHHLKPIDGGKIVIVNKVEKVGNEIATEVSNASQYCIDE